MVAHACLSRTIYLFKYTIYLFKYMIISVKYLFTMGWLKCKKSIYNSPKMLLSQGVAPGSNITPLKSIPHLLVVYKFSNVTKLRPV